VKLGLQLGYWGAEPPTNWAGLITAAADAGFDNVFTVEAWGSDSIDRLHKIRATVDVHRCPRHVPVASRH
jgi:alkanesulfonate monooxygenase SsuD/methylene tetrahydromethanopterin reductase-like flavin-dependent oxidoreductase (luciferase family)